jgi:uncharacterized protein YdeI (YjbR/CyaY-like superfamily)
MVNIADLEVPSSPNGKDIHVPASRAGWRSWLTSNPERSDGLWIVYRKKSSDLDGPTYDDLVEEALCFGWIDSRVRRVDDERVMQWFSPRRPGGLWSALNKARVQRLVDDGLMTDRGRAAIDAARADGSWSQIDDVDALVLPDDLQTALAGAAEAQDAFEALSESAKRRYLWWISSAKRPTTRAARIDATIQRLTAPADDSS